MQSSPEHTGTAGCSALLPIEWQAPRRAEESRIAVEAWLEAVLAFPVPVSLSFVLTVGGPGAARGGLVVAAIDGDAAFEAARLIRSTANALNAWQGLGPPVAHEPVPRGGVSFSLSASEGPGREILSARSAPWALAAAEDAETTMEVQLRGNDTDAASPAVRCTVTLDGHGAAAAMIATLLAADPPGPVRLEAVPFASPDAPPPELSLPLSMVAHLVSSPARIEDAWPSHPVQPPERIVEFVEAATPPHSALFGGSGQGKTTLLEHLVAGSLDAGSTVVVVCPHGDLAARAAEIAHGRGAAFTALDFADEEHCPAWNLCAPPSGVTPQQWAAEMVAVLRAAWSDMPDEYFGPVWNKSVRVALAVLTRDPRGPHPLTELVAVMQPPLQDRWIRALDRIGDQQLRAEVGDLHGAIANDSERHFKFWVTSKLEPFTADERMRRVVGDQYGDIGLDGILQGESCIVSAPASALGDEGASVMVGTLLSQLWHLIRRRPQPARLVDVFVDEAHRIPAAPLVEMLTEGRKFGLRLRLATQSPHQLAPRARDAVLNNTGAVATFRTGPREAAYLDPLFPFTPPGTLNRLRTHWAAATDGAEEMIGPTAPPIVESGRRQALADANRTRFHRQLQARPRAQRGGPRPAPRSRRGGRRDEGSNDASDLEFEPPLEFGELPEFPELEDGPALGDHPRDADTSEAADTARRWALAQALTDLRATKR